NALAEAIDTEQERSLLELAVLSANERERVLEKFNVTPSSDPRDRPVHSIFEEQATKTPDAVAVACEGESVTYLNLNVRANQLARYLVKKGIGPEKRVAVFLDRSVDLLVAMLAIVKAGGAYVPVDPGYPEERLRYMLVDAEAEVVVTTKELSSGLKFPS